MRGEEFAVFSRNGQAVLWRDCRDNLEEAKRRAEEITATEGLEAFVFDVRISYKVATFLPHRVKVAASGQAGWQFSNRA